MHRKWHQYQRKRINGSINNENGNESWLAVISACIWLSEKQ
jgi:hypothetical protein